MSAMGENNKQQILSQDLIRRLLNTSELLEKEYREEVVDRYAMKIQNSGFTKEQTLKIIINGIKGYEGKRKRRAALGLPLRSTAARSRSTRYKKKLLSNANWFRKKKSKDTPASSRDGESFRKERRKEQVKEEQLRVRSVMFVENSECGELRSRIKEVIKNLETLETTLGFTIRGALMLRLYAGVQSCPTITQVR